VDSGYVCDGAQFPGDSVGSPQYFLSSQIMAAQDRVVIDPSINHGKPVIRGTRVPVTVVVGSLAGGMTFEEVQREYDVSAEDIRAALRFEGEQ
jgi:uncharacterized protein (DUF433 family)